MGRIDKSVFRATGSVIFGDVTIGEDCGIWYNAVLRADTDRMEIGARTNIQDNAVLHVDAGFPIEIGEGVTVGQGAILHGCKIGSNSMIGMGAIVLNGAKIGRDCLIGAGALVPGGMEVPDGHIAFGSPCKVRRPMTEDEISGNVESAEEYIHLARLHAGKGAAGAQENAAGSGDES